MTLTSLRADLRIHYPFLLGAVELISYVVSKADNASYLCRFISPELVDQFHLAGLKSLVASLLESVSIKRDASLPIVKSRSSRSAPFIRSIQVSAGLEVSTYGKNSRAHEEQAAKFNADHRVLVSKRGPV